MALRLKSDDLEKAVNFNQLSFEDTFEEESDVEDDSGEAVTVSENEESVSDVSDSEAGRPVSHLNLDEFFRNSDAEDISALITRLEKVSAVPERFRKELYNKLKQEDTSKKKDLGLQVLYEDDLKWYFRSRTVAFVLPKVKSKGFADFTDYALYGLSPKLEVDVNVNADADAEDLDSESAEEVFEETIVAEDSDINSSSDEIDIESSTDLSVEENSEVAEECQVKAEPPYDYFSDFCNKINARLCNPFYYVCKLRDLAEAVKDKKKALKSSAADWNVERLKNIIRLETLDSAGSSVTVHLSDVFLDYALNFLKKDASVYIQGEKLPVYIKSKYGSCYVMPVSMYDDLGCATPGISEGIFIQNGNPLNSDCIYPENFMIR